MEYATEKPDDTLELRVYPGANGKFEYYSDANDTYDYEKGEFAIFTFKWDDAARTLSISDTKGSFPGMIKQRIIKVVLVSNTHGTGAGFETQPDKTITYHGKALTVKM